jgi:hypothetical protein
MERDMLARTDDRLVAYIDKQELEGRRGTLDVTGADFVEVQISHDRDRLWVNARESCLMRIYGMRGMFGFVDLRYPRQEIAWQRRELRWAMRHGTVDGLCLDPCVFERICGAANV